MSQSVGFDWGFLPKSGEKTSGGSAVMASAANTESNYKVSKLRLKRRLTNEDSNVNSGTIPSCRRTAKRKPARCSLILGQPLPLPRAIELMDRDMLQTALIQLVTIHPEVQDTLAKICPQSHDVERYTAMLERKMQAVYDHMPYSKYEAALNDYAFVRMKAAILEFLNCLIDCLLDSIPPRMTNLMQSFRFVAYGTRLLLQIPQFETQSNNYYKNICYEQVAEIWNTLIKHASTDINFLSSRPTLLHYFAELRQLDEQTKGRFAGPVQLFSSVLDGQCTPQGVAVSVVEPPAVAEELGGGNSIEPVGLCNNVA